ncbi:hypothetical protein [Streptomyces sp. NPDC052036]|uniref:hypothetical protein n=1 Tax=Streptomyces sp. NPDC052036 TaxID=3155171 RepID=UPI0034453F6A
MTRIPKYLAVVAVTAAVAGTPALSYAAAQGTATTRKAGAQQTAPTHPDTRRVMPPFAARVMDKYAAAVPPAPGVTEPVPAGFPGGFSGGAGTGPGTRTLWTTPSTPALSTTAALFAERPARDGHPAAPAHLPSSAGALANALAGQAHTGSDR